MINDTRFSLDLKNDISMNSNRFANKKPAILKVDKTNYWTEIVLKDYFEIEGNINHLSVEPLEDQDLETNVKIEQAMEFQSKTHLKKGEDVIDSHRVFIENEKYFAVNLMDVNSFSIFK